MNEVLNQTVVIINPYCNAGQGWKRWLSVKSEVLQLIPGAIEKVLEKGMDLHSVLLPNYLKGVTNIISAGGDGSMHYLINHLLKSKEIDLDQITIGAIGLGSSNDFLKPFNKQINKIPVRINFNEPFVRHDVGFVKFIDENHKHKEKYFIVNASFGITAVANRTFNNPDKVLRFLKKKSIGAAIICTAIKTIFQYRNTLCNLSYNGENVTVPISNINLLKIPFVSGTLYYNQPILKDDGKLGLNICMNMNKWELLSTLIQLEKGIFIENDKKLSAIIESFSLVSRKPVVFECDGETENITNVKINIVPKAVKIASL